MGFHRFLRRIHDNTGPVDIDGVAGLHFGSMLPPARVKSHASSAALFTCFLLLGSCPMTGIFYLQAVTAAPRLSK